MINFPIEFVAQTIRQTLLEEHLRQPKKYAGGDSQIAIHSFYEQLQGQADVDRFVETLRDITDQQNRTALIGNGIILATENPSITNIKNGLIIPMNWTCTLRCTLNDRDLMIDTINNLISKLKGHKVDIAEFTNGQLFKVGSAGGTYGDSNRPTLKQQDYIGEVFIDDPIDAQVKTIVSNYNTQGIAFGGFTPIYFYAEDGYGNMITIIYDSSTNTYKLGGEDIVLVNVDTSNVLYCPTGMNFDKYKLSLSFEAIRCDTPITLNGQEYINISFGGSATLVSLGIKLGNDLQCVCIQKSKITANPEITFNNASKYYLDPIELPSGNSANTLANQLMSNGFKTNTHTDANALTIQYSFILDEEENILEELFDYGRYGTWGITSSDISPNMVFTITEYYASWSKVKVKSFKAKIIESVDIENTESDVMTITTTFQLQGDNN